MNNVKTAHQTIFPGMRYRDARAAIAWFETAFDAKRHVVYEDDGGHPIHVELVVAGNIFMFGVERDDEYPVRSPHSVRGATVGLYVALPDAAAVDALHARAHAAGATITKAPNDTDYGSHDFSALDLDGHPWTFGTYRPS